MRFRAGRMDQRVTLQTRSVVTDAMGQDTITWTDLATVWAELLPLRGAEFFAAAQVQSEQTVKVHIRYRTDVTTSCRLVWGTTNYDVTAVLIVGRKDMLELMCTQGVKDGR